MIKTFFQYLWKKTTSLKDDQEGFVLMLTLSIFLFLFLLSMSIYAVGDTIHKKIQIQNACDAAAYSAAVVQADGLSRMATVNRAMSWTYVQMTNHQMDYITYRWLRLTAKRFQEDYDNAKKFHSGVVIGFQRGGGWATLISWGVDLALSLFIDWKCDGKHTETDESEGKAWWCGMTPDDGHKKLKLNGADEPIEFEALKSLVLEFGSTFDLNQQAQPILSNADTWGGELAKQIEQDRNTLDAMNLALEMINTNTIKAMQETAEFVLKSMLRDSGDDYKDYSVYISIPQGQSPYTLAAAGGKVQRAYFQPLYNTEAYERLFLHMSTQEGVEYPLHKMFPISGDDGDDYDLQGFGLDQWFIRGTGTVADGTTRNEGALGLQRVYKDANLNETGVGVAFPGGKPIARGNHIADVAGVLQQYIPNENSNLLMELFAKPLSSILTAICDTFCDIHPSVGNRVNEEQHLGMCFYSSDTAALYADYNWASGKWLCIPTGNLTVRTMCSDCGHGDAVACGPVSKKHDIGKIVPVRHGGFGHFHIPKWFCGAVEFDWKELIMGAVNGFPIPEEGRHGYSESLFDAKSLTIPFYQLFGKTYNGIIMRQNGNLMIPREKYESCVTFADGLLGLKINKDATAGMFHGHARIYADDKEIWNEHYIGPAVKPWVLNKNYFAGQGTIVVGVARKHTNPLAQIFTYLEEGNSVSQTTVLSAFDPPPGNYMWAMSAARAGYRHTRRDGLYDQHRMYQVVYDPTSDAESLSYESNLEEGKPYYYHETSGDHDTPWKHERPDDETQPLVLAGCVCSGNEERFRYVWNLCETDWDATLLPLRYAGTGAALLVDSGKEKDFFQYDHDTSQDINSWRRDCLDEIKRQGNFEDYVGDGRNWIWYPMPAGGTIGDNVNAMNPGVYLDKVWKPLGSGGNKPNLETLLPGSPGIRLDLERIMKMNRIL